MWHLTWALAVWTALHDFAFKVARFNIDEAFFENLFNRRCQGIIGVICIVYNDGSLIISSVYLKKRNLLNIALIQ